jgi:hypothetical protein
MKKILGFLLLIIGVLLGVITANGNIMSFWNIYVLIIYILINLIVIIIMNKEKTLNRIKQYYFHEPYTLKSVVKEISFIDLLLNLNFIIAGIGSLLGVVFSLITDFPSTAGVQMHNGLSFVFYGIIIQLVLRAVRLNIRSKYYRYVSEE